MLHSVTTLHYSRAVATSKQISARLVGHLRRRPRQWAGQSSYTQIPLVLTYAALTQPFMPR